MFISLEELSLSRRIFIGTHSLPLCGCPIRSFKGPSAATPEVKKSRAAAPKVEYVRATAPEVEYLRAAIESPCAALRVPRRLLLQVSARRIAPAK
jgi:hypothetical protein